METDTRCSFSHSARLIRQCRVPVGSNAAIVYRSYRPTPVLSPYISRYWMVDVVGDVEISKLNWRICYDTCVSLFFDFSREDTLVYAFGTLTHSRDSCSDGYQRYVVVDVRAAYAHALLRVSMECVRDGQFDLREHWPRGVPRLIEQLRLASNSDRAVTEFLDGFLLNKFDQIRPNDTILNPFVRRVLDGDIEQRIDKLAVLNSMSLRTFERQAQRALGLSPKQFCRAVRFHRAKDAIRRYRPSSWSDFALDHGYSDQSHLIREMKLFSGFTPRQLLALYGSSTGRDRLMNNVPAFVPLTDGLFLKSL